jgi:hypothetical protein
MPNPVLGLLFLRCGSIFDYCPAGKRVEVSERLVSQLSDQRWNAIRAVRELNRDLRFSKVVNWKMTVLMQKMHGQSSIDLYDALPSAYKTRAMTDLMISQYLRQPKFEDGKYDADHGPGFVSSYVSSKQVTNEDVQRFDNRRILSRVPAKHRLHYGIKQWKREAG